MGVTRVKEEKFPLPVDVRRSKTSVLKLPNIRSLPLARVHPNVSLLEGYRNIGHWVLLQKREFIPRGTQKH